MRSSSFLTRTTTTSTHSLSTTTAESKISPFASQQLVILHSSSNNRNDQIIVSGGMGGDYAGLAATFSSKSGELISVPQHLIPSSMIEWGDIPSCLEVLTSEDYDTKDDDDELKVQPSHPPPPLLRTMITVLPEVGCGIDNLEVIKTSETLFHQDVSDHRLECWKYDSYGHCLVREEVKVVVVADRLRQSRTNQQHILDVETIFQVVDDSDMIEKEEMNNNINNNNSNIEENDTTSSSKQPRPHRIRISFSLDFTKSLTKVLSNIVTIHVERQYSLESTRGIRWTGLSYNSGGLDARTVMKTIGKGIMYGDVFGVKRMGKGGNYGSSSSSSRRQDPWLFPHHNITMVEDNEDGETSILEGLWTKTLIHPRATTSTSDGIEVYRTKQDFEQVETSTMVTIRLPQNILLRYGSDSSSPDNMSWKIEVSHIDTIAREGKIHLQRRVVLRSFDQQILLKQAGQKERLGDVSHWVEHKILN